jgi:hypothetical protein
MNLASGEVVLSFTKHVLYTMEILVGSIWDKSLKSFLPFYSQSLLLIDFTPPPPPPEQKWFETGL